jgi:hypothetical protein
MYKRHWEMCLSSDTGRLQICDDWGKFIREIKVKTREKVSQKWDLIIRGNKEKGMFLFIGTNEIVWFPLYKFSPSFVPPRNHVNICPRVFTTPGNLLNR